MGSCVIDMAKIKKNYVCQFFVGCSLMLKLLFYLFMYWLMLCLSLSNSRWHTILPLSSFPHKHHCGLNCHFYIFSKSHGRKLTLCNLVGRIFFLKCVVLYTERESQRVEAVDDPTVHGIFLVMGKNLQFNHIISRYVNTLKYFHRCQRIFHVSQLGCLFGLRKQNLISHF